MNKALIFICLSTIIQTALSQNKLSIDFEEIEHSHDIKLAAWGPYSKKYAGVSHINDIHEGKRFDFSVFPGFYRNKLIVPNVRYESGYFPWHSSPDLKKYTFRYELEWKDKVFVDVTYTIEDSLTTLVEMRCVNNSKLPQNLSLNLMSWITYPDGFPKITLPNSQNFLWINGVDYSSMNYATPRPKDNLVTDGWIRGEIRNPELIGGTALARGFGKESGDHVTFKFNLPSKMEAGVVTLWYKMKENGSCPFILSGLVNENAVFSGNGELTKLSFNYSEGRTSETITLESMGGDEVILNGIQITQSGADSLIQLQPFEEDFNPEIISDNQERTMILKYNDLPDYYGFRWNGTEDFRFREVRNDELDIFFKELVHSHVASTLWGNNKGHYANIFIRPVELKPQSEKTITGILCTGSLEQVQNTLTNLRIPTSSATHLNKEVAILPQGEPYLFSRKMLQATILTDVVYPIYTQRDYIRHFPPGKWWNSLYTWDSGFIAIGLNEINPDLAAQCLNAYTTPVGNQSAFVHHGSPIPVQMYAFLELWNKTQSRELLSYFYPQLKQYYEFMSGRLGSSTTRTLKSNLLRTWDYFYNSGGWDDYPAQIEVHRQKAEQSVTPVINTAQQIRIAKILRLAAEELEETNDLAIYDHDILEFSEALQKHSWNKSSGYFSYVRHDTNGRPIGPLMYEETTDFNMGLDGAYPLLSGICTPEQEKVLIDKIFSEKNMWTPSGISVVDQSAPYYRIDGYWNGSVWMPHQWFMWKTMLDLGHPELAFKIADKALKVYSKETNESYYTFEHFLAKSGRGAGWHQFSGLSTPILSWFSAYYKQGTATTGFEIWINRQKFHDNFSGYTAEITFDKATRSHRRSIMLCLNPDNKYKATMNQLELKTSSPYDGLLYIEFPNNNESGKLIVEPISD